MCFNSLKVVCLQLQSISHFQSRWFLNVNLQRRPPTSRYVEDITTKTGNFKKYSVFVKMLHAAVVEESDSVFVDLLTYADLEMLKNKRSHAPPSQSSRPAGHVNNKRYLILTYAARRRRRCSRLNNTSC